MRKASRIYKRKTRSNVETLIILVGAIIILGVAFHLAREKSYIPPEEPVVAVEQKQIEIKPSEEKIPQVAPSITVEKAGEEKVPESKEKDISVSSPKIEIAPSIVSEKVTKAPAEEEVTILQETTKSSESKVYTVQVGAFSSEKNARSLALEIKGKGFNTYVVKGGDLYKVQVGALKSQQEAQSLSNRLKELGYPIFVTTR